MKVLVTYIPQNTRAYQYKSKKDGKNIMMKIFEKNSRGIARGARREVTRTDKVWMHSIVKRQYMVLDDLVQFSELYPDQLDREIVGSLFSIYEMLCDNADSLIMRHSTN